MEGIKPCCNCGCLEAEVLSENEDKKYPPLYGLRCKACGYPLSGTLAGPYMYWREAQEAQDEWNRRADNE